MLESTRANVPPTGSVRVKLGFVAPAGTASLMDFKEVFRELRKREGRASWVSAPPVSLFARFHSRFGSRLFSG